MQVSHREMFEELLRAAKSGDADAQLSVAVAYLTGLGVLANKKEALIWCQDAARQGSVRAQILLGYMLHFGIGVEANQHEADIWFWRAAQREIYHNEEVQNALISYSSMVKVSEDLSGVVYRFRSPHGEQITWRCTLRQTEDGQMKRSFRRVPTALLFPAQAKPQPWRRAAE